MNFEIKRENGDEIEFFKGRFEGYHVSIRDDFRWSTFTFTKEEIKELISYLQREIQNEKN